MGFTVYSTYRYENWGAEIQVTPNLLGCGRFCSNRLGLDQYENLSSRSLKCRGSRINSAYKALKYQKNLTYAIKAQSMPIEANLPSSFRWYF